MMEKILAGIKSKVMLFAISKWIKPFLTTKLSAMVPIT